METDNIKNESKRETIQISKSSLNSLVFFVFGATIDEGLYLLYRVVNKAMFDATSQGSFNTSLKNEKEKENAKKAKSAAVAVMFEAMRKGVFKPNFVEWHYNTCNAVKKPFECWGLGDFFSYGNAQKIVNMTLKYLYLLSSIVDYCGIPCEVKEIFTAVKDESKTLHIPIDSYIIDAIWQKTDEEERKKLPERESDVRVNYANNDYKRPSDHIKGWSSWDEHEYNEVQELIGQKLTEDNINPMEWEADTWISISKKRRETDELWQRISCSRERDLLK